MARWTPKRGYKPLHLRMIHMYHQGFTMDEIALEVGTTPQQVSNIIATPEAQDLLARVREATFDSIIDIRTNFQSMAPECASKLFNLAMTAKDSRTQLSACTAILDRAGHTATKRVEIGAPGDFEKDITDLTEDELRDDIRRELGLAAAAPDPATPGKTVH